MYIFENFIYKNLRNLIESVSVILFKCENKIHVLKRKR